MVPGASALIARLRDLRIGYAPYRRDLAAPGDRRRFARYAAQRGLQVEVADPGGTYDLVVVSERADLTTWARWPRPTLMVYDLIDSYLALPASNPKALLRGTAKFIARQHRRWQPSYWESVRAMCRRADAVICSTAEQSTDIRPHCANVHIILDIHDGEMHPVKAAFAAHAPFALLWEGLAVNVHSLGVIAPALERIGQRRALSLRVVTDPTSYRWLGRVGERDTLAIARRFVPSAELVPWSPAALLEEAANADLAVIPIPLDDAFARGKPENKLLLLWRLGLPVVTSATPAYSRAMTAAGLPLTCRTSAEWESTIERCMTDHSFRADSAIRGLAYASQHGEAHTLAQWDALFASIVPQTDEPGGGGRGQRDADNSSS